MGVRITGISTPVGGISWEYKNREEEFTPRVISPGQKIKVFISSICGVEKYDKVRAELKSAIEATQLADVYTFEGKGASILPAGAHYALALEDSDICIFLIDNADGITQGVQVEIDTVKKHNIQALYYFCDETQKEKTALEQSLMGAHFAKSKTVHSFSQLSQNGAQALIDDIITIYHYYCTGRIVLKPDDTNEIQRVAIKGIEKYQLPTIPKIVLENVDRCADYILKFALGYSRFRLPNKEEKTSEVDEWGEQFLPILFEGKSIKHFNTVVYLDVLKLQQDEAYYQIVQVRWWAIQAYFMGDVEKCIEQLKAALNTAQKTGQPTWVIKDILIDLRNEHWTCCTMKNEFVDPPAQKELTESSEEIYYPILDRIDGSLHEKYIGDLYKKKTESLYSVTIGSNLNEYSQMLASSFIVAMYNGSLTHLLLVYKKMQDFIFYLSCQYDDWILKFNLYKLAIFDGEQKNIKELQNTYAEVLNRLTAEEALSIIKFCQNHPIKYKRLSSQLLALGAVGYFLSDKSYKYYENDIVNEIKSWLTSEGTIVSIGGYIFQCLSGIAVRMEQDTLGEICCLFIQRHYSRWYVEMFKFIANSIDLRKMSNNIARTLIEYINDIFDNETERELIKYAPTFLCILRNQDRALTDNIDGNVAKYLPSYYKGLYKLATTPNSEEDILMLVKKYTEQIRKNNERQGREGRYFAHGIREIATLRGLLLKNDIRCDSEIMDNVISVIADTILISKEDIWTKLDAIALLSCIAVKYSEDYLRNQSVYQNLYEQREIIEIENHPIISSNINNIALKIGLQFLYVSMNVDVYSDILELMPYIQGDIATTNAVSQLIAEYLEITDTVILPRMVEAVILQNVLHWLKCDYLEIKWNATRILLAMSRNPDNSGIVNHQLLQIIDSSGAYIKNGIMRRINKLSEIADSTKEYILSKCKDDTNFVVRMAYQELNDKH